MQDNPGMDQPQVPEYKPPMPLMARLINVFAAPGEVFEDVRDTPPSTANWLVPALISVLVGWICSAIIFASPAIQQQMSEISQKAIEQQIQKMNASEQQAEQMRAAADKFGSIGQKISAYAGPPVMAFASPFIWGLIVWLIGSKKFRAGFPYMKGVEAVGLSNMIGVLDGIIRTLLILVLGTIWAAPHAGMVFMGNFDPQNPLHAILSLLNIMTFWLLAVRAIAVARLSGASFGRSAVWVFGIWFAYTALFMGFGFAMQKIFGAAQAAGS